MTRLLALCAALTLCACFAPDNPLCAFACGLDLGNNGDCPDDYECRTDGYCHLIGSTGMCPFPSEADLAVPPIEDMSTNDGAADGALMDMTGNATADMSMIARDLASADLLVSVDGASPDLASHD